MTGLSDRYPPIQAYETLTLDKVRFRGNFAVSRYAMENGDVRRYEDEAMQRLIYEVNTHVLGRQMTDELEIAEEPIYHSWRHMLVASLPDGFRRRFLSFLWRMDDNDLAKRRRHQVSIQARCVFPDAEVRVPKELGAPYRFASLSSYSAWDSETPT